MEALPVLPADRVRLACRRWGEPDVALRCAALLAGGTDPDLLAVLAGQQSGLVRAGDANDWPRVWAARALTYAWDPGAAGAVRSALDNPAWRVREMAAKVCAVRELGAAAEDLDRLLADPVPRVRAAAARALALVGEAEHAPGLRALLTDPDGQVRVRAERALATLSARLDRPVW